MARRGRPRAAGKRTPSGRLSKAGQDPSRIKPTPQQEKRSAVFGNNWPDAIGRAFELHFLGVGSDAKARLDLARSLSGTYWRAYAVGAPRSTLGSFVAAHGISGAIEDPLKEKARENWLVNALALADQAQGRKIFDSLVIDINPDHGPAWLDRLIGEKLSGGKYKARPGDRQSLELCLEILDRILRNERAS